MDNMKTALEEGTGMTLCEGCQKPTPDHDLVHYGSADSFRTLCLRCVNEDMAERCDVDFEHVQFEPITMTDHAGAVHEFHFSTRLLGDICSLEAFELRGGSRSGYQFQAIGDAEADLWELMAKLIERIRRALSVSYLCEDRGELHIAGQSVSGRISCELDGDGFFSPALIVDGRDISWEEFGRMLSTFEGWQFKLQILDPSDAA